MPTKPLTQEFLDLAELLSRATDTVPALPFCGVGDAIKYRAVFNRDRLRFKLLHPEAGLKLDNFEVIVRRGDGLTETAARGRHSGPGFHHLLGEAKRAIELADSTDLEPLLDYPTHEGKPCKDLLWYVIFIFKSFSASTQQHIKLTKALLRTMPEAQRRIAEINQLAEASEARVVAKAGPSTPDEKQTQAMINAGFLQPPAGWPWPKGTQIS